MAPPELGEPLLHLPLIPVGVLKQHRVWIPADTRFRSAARLLQALYREERGLKMGTYVAEDNRRHKLGSRIALAVGNTGANFFTPEIFHVALKELAYRERGALYDVERLALNLLSSMPLVFNLLAPWQSSLERTQGYLIELLPAFIGTPTEFLFEHSPGRGDPQFTADYSAFDALIRFTDASDNSGFIALEIKLTESMQEPLAELRPRYAELSETSGLFIDHAADALRKNPLQQCWREIMLAQSMIDIGLYDLGYFVLIFPELNYHIQEAVELFQAHLREPVEGKVRFVSLTLENVVETIRQSDPEHANALHHRYCNFGRVVAELNKAEPSFGLTRKRLRKTPEWP